MDAKLIEKIHGGHGQFVLAVTGGGSSAIADLFSIPGASASMLETLVPYHAAALEALTASSDNGCNPVTARRMAMAAYQRARQYRSAQDRQYGNRYEVNDVNQVNGPVFGIGLTAAIATNRERRGADRCHAVLQSATRTLALDITLEKSLSRPVQEAVCNRAVIWLMLAAIEATESTFSLRSDEGEARVTDAQASEAWSELLTGYRGSSRTDSCRLLFPGSFNPLHAGHEQMIACAEQRTGHPATLEISIRNVDKPPLDFLTMRERADSLARHPLAFTNAPTFVEKSALFPGAVFIVGADTIVRIADPKYYADVAARDEAIAEMARRGNRFLVFGRTQGERFQTLTDADLPPALRQLCDEVPEGEFRQDISSTELRDRDTQGQHVP